MFLWHPGACQFFFFSLKSTRSIIDVNCPSLSTASWSSTSVESASSPDFSSGVQTTHTLSVETIFPVASYCPLESVFPVAILCPVVYLTVISAFSTGLFSSVETSPLTVISESNVEGPVPYMHTSLSQEEKPRAATPNPQSFAANAAALICIFFIKSVCIVRCKVRVSSPEKC